MLTIMSIVQMIGNMAVPMFMEKWPSRMAWLLVLSFVGVIGFIFAVADIRYLPMAGCFINWYCVKWAVSNRPIVAS